MRKVNNILQWAEKIEHRRWCLVINNNTELYSNPALFGWVRNKWTAGALFRWIRLGSSTPILNCSTPYRCCRSCNSFRGSRRKKCFHFEILSHSSFLPIFVVPGSAQGSSSLVGTTTIVSRLLRFATMHGDMSFNRVATAASLDEPCVRYLATRCSKLFYDIDVDASVVTSPKTV